MTESPASPVPALSPVSRVPADRYPAFVYLATLAPCDNRRSITATLAQVATLLGCPDPEASAPGSMSAARTWAHS